MKKICFILAGVLLVVGAGYAVQTVDILPLTKGITVSATSVGSTATAIPATALVGRRSIAIYNNGTVTVYIGGSGVTTATGYPLTTSKRDISMDLDDSVVVYGIVASGTCPVRALEVK